MQMIDLNSLKDSDFKPGLQRARIRYPDIDLDRCKLIGYGAGYQFEKFYPLLGIKLDYTVCEWEIDTGLIKDGDTKCGVKVHHASRLREENPDEVLIVVFAGRWYDCMRQIPSYGRFKAIRAMNECAESGRLEYCMQQVFDGSPAVAPLPGDDASIGLVVQGPVLPHITPMVLAVNRRKFPFATLVLSTWDDTPADLLDACAPYVDEIVTSPVPALAGAFNAVMQRNSTQAGLAALLRRGVKYAFKTRTDQSIIGAVDVTHLLELARLPVDGKDAGLRERIVFCPQHSWRFIPFHLTDQLQFGRVEDLLEYWQCRDDSILYSAALNASSPANHISLVAPESCFTRCYLRRIGVDYELTLASYWKVVNERFAMMPDSEISFFNWKSVALFDVPVQGDLRAGAMANPVSMTTVWRFSDWQALRENQELAVNLGGAVDRMNLSREHFFRTVPFDLPLPRE